MKVLVISGHACAGKDTVAGYLKERLESRGSKVLITHYADLLKYICKTFFGWNGEKDEAGRTMLQKVGTDQIRECQPNYFVSFVCDILRFFPNEWDYVLIPDCRFPNEIEYLKNNGFDVVHVRVERTSSEFVSKLTEEQKKHPSETALNGYMYDVLIYNNWDLDTLKKHVYAMCSAIVSNDICINQIV